MQYVLKSSGLTTDSSAYEVLEHGIVAIKNIDGLICEIGTRRGGSARIIIDSLLKNSDVGRTLICLDPYGNIEYAEREGVVRRLDYTNEMKSDTQRNLYAYAHQKPINVQLLILEDTEFFNRFYDGYPVYNEHKQLINEYAFVFFDGPHDIEPLKVEIDFFNERAKPGAVFVFDDTGYYDHFGIIDPYLCNLNWEMMERKDPKVSYVKRLI